MILWTLSYVLPSTSVVAGPVPLASLGLSRPRRKLVSQGVSTLRLRAPGRPADAAYLFPHGTTVTLYRNATPWFYGLVTRTPSMGSGKAESQDYEVSDPWWYLENLVYMQQWVQPDYPGATPANDPYRSHCFLNQWAYDPVHHTFSRTPTDQQIAMVIAYAKLFNAIPIQLPATPGLIPSMDIPLEEVSDITCAEVIRKQLRWMPDAVTYFDYNTTPPTLWIQRRSRLTPVSIAFPTASAPGALCEFRVNPRYDLLRTAVNLYYTENTAVSVGSVVQTWLLVHQDLYPPTADGHEVTDLVLTIHLEGADERDTQATISVGAISDAVEGSSIVGDGWWISKYPALAGYSTCTITSLEFETSNGPGPPVDGSGVTYSNELLSGQITPWMPCLAQECSVVAQVAYSIAQPGGGTAKTGVQTISAKVMMTNAPAGTNTYYSVASATAGENAPVGLARFLYESVGFLHYEGMVSLVEPECSGLAGLGNTLNISGSAQADWAGMNAIVQSVEEDLEAGTTEITIGPPSHLGAPDLIELLRLNRFRITYTNPATQIQTAQVTGQTRLGQQTALENTIPGPSTYQQFGIQAGWSAPGSTAAPSLGGNSSAIAQNGALSSTIPAPPAVPAHTPPWPASTPDPAQGAGMVRGASVVLGPAPAAGSLPSGISAHAATIDPSAWACLRICDLLGSDGNYHPVYFQEMQFSILQTDGTCATKRAMVPISALY